ncbi:MAG: Hpt domain-containing protein [Lachnospiraceae bacterium]|nr:Hpt domain-containing protein [Lachnospiraceae bacterium]
MTLKELYLNMGGDYDQAIGVLRIEKLVDKHIRKFAKNDVAGSFFAAGESMDPVRLFETSHALKGICANLGLKNLGGIAQTVTEEFRPGNPRKISDEEVKQLMDSAKNVYSHITESIAEYESAGEQK